MNNWPTLLNTFLLQSQKGDLKTSSYPKEWSDLKMKVSFGMGAPARIPWIAFVAPEMQVSKGFYPVYLYYKELETLVLAYGVSETEEFAKTWPADIMNSTVTVAAHFNQDVPRYGDSYVFKTYKIKISNDQVLYLYSDSGQPVTEKDLESDLHSILEYYKKTVSIETTSPTSALGQGLFYMESQLEDFIINNWENTELGKKYNLIVEDGEMISQQYKTALGPIDILAKDKISGSHVVIELKKNQTSDDTVGQVTRYMGEIKTTKKDDGVKGVIIGGAYDKKLASSLKMISNVDVYIYEVDFKLKEFKEK